MRTDVLHAVRLARIDLTMLGRNQTALFNVVLLPLLIGWMYTTLAPEQSIEGVPADLFILTGLSGMMLGFVVFVNLVNSFTARREELVLKRLRGGQSSSVAIFGGAGLSAFALYAFQTVLLSVWISRLGDGGMPSNIPLMLLTGVLGVAVFALIAAAFSGITRNAELAQISVLPVLLVVIIGSPVMGPLSVFPEPLQIVSKLIPTTPVTEIMRTAYLGRDFIGDGGGTLTVAEQWIEALPSLGVLVVWVGVAALLARWLFRWDPRHG
ncbi:ABC-2 type transport system permease protein [Sinosporangium album]|uniref:ABC-2 type transport system permease protein n=1 Tax=Sinosporangium album TaxID=504805 RepID=A0A1G7V3S1_9ACTN|nr:ABC transporter permease [Sinosporangium album]SDG54525.1 ABC-2 type transport system permease protein [Sinosporangium album]